MKVPYILLVCCLLISMSCSKNPTLPTTEEVKEMILKDIKQNSHKYLLMRDYDDMKIQVAQIRESKDYDPKTKRVSYSYTAEFTGYKGTEVQFQQTVFNTLPLEYITDIGWRKRTIKIVL